MNNNQTQPTTQPNPKRFQLKTWQWLSVLIIAAVIAGGVFVIFSLNECQKCSLTHWWSIGACDRVCIEDFIQQANYCQTESDCMWVCGCGCINKERNCETPEGIMYDCYPGMEEKYSCVCLDNQCKTIKVDMPVQQINITTNKTEYEQGERVKVVVKNNSTSEKCISPGFGVENFRIKWEKIRKVGCPCEIMCSLQQCENLKQGEVKEFSWDQEESWCSEPQGRSETMYQQVPGGIYRAEIQANGEIIYSNEFTIK